MGILDFLKRDPRKKRCTRCGQPSVHGYSQVAESPSDQITSLCLRCLTEQLQQDYSGYHGKSIVVAPAPSLPCYTFRDVEYLSSIRARWRQDFGTLFQEVRNCTDCKSKASILWVNSRGLSLETFAEVLEKGLQQSLLAWGNPAPIPLCGACVAKRIGECLRSGGPSFFEVCSPHGEQQGMVLPMAL